MGPELLCPALENRHESCSAARLGSSSGALRGDPGEVRLVLPFALLQVLSHIPNPHDTTVALDECAKMV